MLLPASNPKQAHEDLLSSVFGERVKQRYLTFARAVDMYCTRLYTEWEQRVGAVATDKLKQPILFSKVVCPQGLLCDDLHDITKKEGAPTTIAGPRAKKSCITHPSLLATEDTGYRRIPPPPYGVNFAPDLHMIIRESKYLDRMGFQASVQSMHRPAFFRR